MSLQTPERMRRSSHAVDTSRVEEFRKRTHATGRGASARCYIVHALGREFVVSDEMAQIFLRQVERVLEANESSLVVLRHHQGLELLLVTDDSSFSIRQDPISATRS
jgi:hypothetical protein